MRLALLSALVHPRQRQVTDPLVELPNSVIDKINARSLALCHKAGFTCTLGFTGPGGRGFRELTLRSYSA